MCRPESQVRDFDFMKIKRGLGPIQGFRKAALVKTFFLSSFTS